MNPGLHGARSNWILVPLNWSRFFTFLVIFGLVFGPNSAYSVTSALAGAGQRAPVQPLALTSALTLRVVSARSEPDHPGGPVTKGAVIPQYKFLINVDNTGDPAQARQDGCTPDDPAYPQNCNWPSIRAVPGAAPIFTQGDQSLLNQVTSLNLPDGKYLISVTADGYKIGGAHFSVPFEGSGLVEVALQPHPLPSATMQIKVYDDISPVNGQFDAPAEQGLAGFTVLINDILGQVTTDVFGNPLCTQYDSNGNPTGQTNCLVSDANGDIVVPNLGPNRYDVNVTPPLGSDWIQTTTLEGSHSWDTWLQEGGNGLDNEFVVAGEPFPWTSFGFVHPTDKLNSSAAGKIKGTIVSAAVYVPWGGAGLPYYGQEWDGLSGVKLTGPVKDAWVALSDLQNGDTSVYVAPVDPNTGAFTIDNIPNGNYMFTYWDYRQHYILDWLQVTVSNGQVLDLGTPYLTGWFTWVDGYVFNDLNSNGKRDPGEPGISDYTVVLKDRDNTEIDRMTIAVTTNHDGYYYFDRAYPMGSWMILEAYNDRYYTTGVTYQVENQPEPTTVIGSGVDVGVLPTLGQTGRLDWGVRPYAPGTNGGIVGTVFYDTTRNELDARYQAVEGWAPGIPGLRVNVYKSMKDANGNFIKNPDGSYARGALVNSSLTETWERPVNCQPRDAEGNPVAHPNLLPPATGDHECLEGPLMGLQFQTGFSTLDGNYGFGTIFPDGLDPTTYEPLNPANEVAMPAGDYLVEVVVPEDSFGRPQYKVVKEEDINVFSGDEFVQQIPPPACAGPLHTVDVAGMGADGPDAVDNPGFADAGGSPFEGMPKPLCDTKLVTVSSGRSVAPTFNLFTDVPIPGRWKGYIINDLALSTNPQELMFGEKAGLNNMPIGIYDFTGRLVDTVASDPNGVYEVLLPSTESINCPTPSGVCPGVYYILGNDPGQPGRPNLNYNPQFRTIGASFEIWPGAWLPSDLAPTQMVPTIIAPGSTDGQPTLCLLDDATPQLYAVSRPYANVRAPFFPLPGQSDSFVIYGKGFGATKGPLSQVTLNGSTVLPTTSWSDTQINVSVPSNTPPGPWQLQVTGANGRSTVNGLTFHVRNVGLTGTRYTPVLYEVGPGKPFATIQAAIDAASAVSFLRGLVVVYPGTPTQWDPFGTYFENPLLYAPIKLQGVGPGGGAVLGSVIDGRGVLGDADAAAAWRDKFQSLTFDGNQAMYEGAVVTVVAEDGAFTSQYKAAIDGFTIQGGDQQAFPGEQPGAEAVTIQGGGIFVNAYARYLQISNNILRSNGGAYGGAIRVGTPNLPGSLKDNQNDGLTITHNRILANGGTNLAGGVGIFAGANDYDVSYNDVCGNFSAEYGGGISQYGYSPNGSIHHNRIYFNRSYDEGGGVMIAGELPADPALLSPGSGPVNIYANLILGNLANDDGGGLRFLMAGNFPMNVYNNMLANNVSTHEGGGISINDAPNVRVINNTIMKNITTATAQTSDGSPAPAGLSSSQNSALLQVTLPPGAPIFSDPLVFNNIFWDNRAGSWDGGGIAGIGLQGDPNPINYWDLGVSDGVGLLSPTNSVMQTNQGVNASPSNLLQDPQVVMQYDTSVTVLPWRGNPHFVDTLLVALDAPVEQLGNYHITTGSPAVNKGAASKSGVNAPILDIDGQGRPLASIDAGADELVGAVQAFPVTSVLDNFNRANGAVGSAWRGWVSPTTGAFRIFSNTAQVYDSGSMWWNSNPFGPDQEAFFTFSKVSSNASAQGLVLKFTGTSTSSSRASFILAAYHPSTQIISVRTRTPGQGWVTWAVFPATFAAGDRFGARAQSDGTVNVYKNGALVGSINLLTGPTPWPAAYVNGTGRVGAWFTWPTGGSIDSAQIDDFGGGTLP